MHLRKLADQNSHLEQAVVQCRHCAWAWHIWQHRLQVALWEQLQHSRACQVLLLHHVWCQEACSGHVSFVELATDAWLAMLLVQFSPFRLPEEQNSVISVVNSPAAAAALQNAGYAGLNTIPADHTLVQVTALQ